jgi:hypothetical protein
VRWRLERYLKKEAHTGDFKVEFPFPSKEEMAKAPPKSAEHAGPSAGARTGKDYETLRNEYFALKNSALALERGLLRNETELKETTAKLNALAKELADAASTNLSTLRSNETVLRERVAALQKKAGARSELQAKDEMLAPIVRDLWEFQRAWLAEPGSGDSTSGNHLTQARARFASDIRQKLDQARSYSEMYHLVGQEIWVAARLLGSASPEHRRAGVSLVLDASRHALNDAQNGWVAARICEGYVLPNLDLADDTNRRSTFNPQNLLNECADIFRRNNEFNNVVRTYEIAFARARTPTRADAARAQLAIACEDAGDPRRALQYLRQIQDTNDFRWALRRVPRLEQQAKAN